jgi:hypothetical protein
VPFEEQPFEQTVGQLVAPACGDAEPSGAVGIISCHAAAVEIDPGDTERGVGVTLAGGQAIEFEGTAVIARHTLGVLIAYRLSELRRGIVGRRDRRKRYDP